MCDNSENPHPGVPGHDPLDKLRNFITMAEENFRTVYKPSRDISLDESSCPFKGRVWFHCYNPSKPNR